LGRCVPSLGERRTYRFGPFGVCADGRGLGWMWIMRDIEVLDFSGSWCMRYVRSLAEYFSSPRFIMASIGLSRLPSIEDRDFHTKYVLETLHC